MIELRAQGADEGELVHDNRGLAPEGGASFIPHLLSVIRRRKWLVIGTTIAAVLLGILVTLLMAPQYTARATLEIQRENTGLTNVDTTQSSTMMVDQEFYETQYGLLQSRSLAERVVKDLGLADSKPFLDSFGVKTADWFNGSRISRAAPPAPERMRIASDILLSRFKVAPERMSRLVGISFTSPDPALSKRVVDAWSAAFVQETLDRRFEATAYARKFLEGKLSQLRGRIDESERRLVDYASREGIVNLPAGDNGDGASSPERPIAADDLTSLNRELARATADRVLAESKLRAGGGQSAEVAQNPTVVSLRSKRAELAGDYAKMRATFESEYPPAKALESQIAQLDRAIGQEEKRIGGTLRQAYEASVKREDELKSEVSGLKTGMLDMRRRSIQYNIFLRDVDTNRQLYDGLLQRYKTIGVAGSVGLNNISVVDGAEMPRTPSSPKPLLNILIAVAAGLFLGLSAALVFEQLDQGVDDPAEVEALLGVPLLGTVPQTGDTDPRTALGDPKSPITEAYLSLRTNLSFATDHGTPHVFAVTSTGPAEGKTTTSYALARSLARANRKVLLIDADMRSPSIHYMFEVGNKMGLSNYLAGSDDAAALIVPTSVEGLWIMPAGPQPPSAPELLSSERFEKLIAELRGSFDHLILDAPPVMGLADAPIIGSKVEGAVFVVESHATQKGLARVAVTRMMAANANMLGAILTKFNVRRAHYGYGYDYGYGYGYGDTAKRGTPAA
ncbi:polysaccharide biosynthesis tyrosine autokinase [Sphingomonas sp. HITSZ_GF]|uniref:GumC family protein n=1 Tax=Sphingomonas sp. HITSZ_GF TaxID=3037247 RepID=UPI00240D2BEA|nr:polysaccharide biosynthesis tyrosine autokinase [Sphingomonas sp. HITSZ_GF]MDG2535779.1 polysaccharide biosynthesis tyrosine autokinase [Sphingomonas sp. HITSZ_GF]